MARKKSPIRQLLSPTRIMIPIGIGLAVVAYVLLNEFDIEKFRQISWTGYSTFWFVIALLMVATRDLGYMYRIRHLTDKKISWRNSFDVIMLWEFASAITPSVVGGSGVAIFIVNREGVSMGKSTAVVMITAFLDELFYVVTVPVIILIVGFEHLFPLALQKSIFGIDLGVRELFFVGYGFIVVLISVIFYAIFIDPGKFKNLLTTVFRLPFLRKWRTSAAETGDEIIVTSKELKGKPRSFWLKAFGATLFSWTARFWIVNFLILSFSAAVISGGDHFLIYARQLVMWVILLISPTPGGTGVAEFAFSGFLEDFIVPSGIAVSLALLWRLLSYYPYLVMGVIILPRWIRRVYLKRKLISFKRG